MSVRMPLPKSAASILKAALLEKGMTLSDAQSLDMVARLYGYNSWYSLSQDAEAQKPSLLRSKSRNEFELGSTNETCRIRVQSVVLEVQATEEMVNVRLWPTNGTAHTPLDEAGIGYKEAAKDRRKPDPDKAFYGCRLPYGVTAIELLEGETTRRVPVTDVYETVLEWLEEGCHGDQADELDEVIEYQDQGRQTIDADELLYAELASDGLFTLPDGRKLYLLDKAGQRWAPTARL